jgi:hypothetical protein
MKKIILFFTTLCCALSLIAQKKYSPKITTILHKLGNDHIQLKIFQYGKNKDIVYINLHADETTSIAGAENFLQTRGGLLIKLENANKRNISFRLKGGLYTFDPNRIFSRNGIRLSLSQFENINDKAVKEVEKFATRIVKFFPKESYCVISLHNNTDGDLSVNSFLPGNEYEKDAQKVYANDKQDPDDFFLTTDSLLFQQLSAEKYNSVWQDNLRVQQDGSLSVYFGEKNICYLNCETEHGKIRQYKNMISVALKYISQRKNSMNSVIP